MRILKLAALINPPDIISLDQALRAVKAIVLNIQFDFLYKGDRH